MAELIIEVPDEFAARVGAALRTVYPDVTAGSETDGQAMRAVVAFWTANLLADFEATKVRDAGHAKILAAERELDAAVASVRAQAWASVRDIMASPAEAEVP